jgi:hypothetical protein
MFVNNYVLMIGSSISDKARQQLSNVLSFLCCGHHELRFAVLGQRHSTVSSRELI